MPLNDFPHSKQNGLARGVINPQKGHILCDPKPSVFFANSFLRDSTINASKARVWKRKGCISGTRCFLRKGATPSHLRQAHDYTSPAAILCKIAQFT